MRESLAAECCDGVLRQSIKGFFTLQSGFYVEPSSQRVPFIAVRGNAKSHLYSLAESPANKPLRESGEQLMMVNKSRDDTWQFDTCRYTLAYPPAVSVGG